MTAACFAIPTAQPVHHKGACAFIRGESVLPRRPKYLPASQTLRPAWITTVCSEPIKEQLAWVDAIPIGKITPGKLERRILVSLDICIACVYDGQVYALANKGTPLGVPLSDGTIAEVEGKYYVKCPQYGTLFDPQSGDVKDMKSWVPSPPILANIIRALFPNPISVPAYPVRVQNNMLQVLLNTNARTQYETTYWKGILDASGKADGSYY